MTKQRLIQLICGVALLVLLPIGAARAAQGQPNIAERFRDYYTCHQGIRVLGYPPSSLVEADGYPAQYFEKGRIEDHRADRLPSKSTANWSTHRTAGTCDSSATSW